MSSPKAAIEMVGDTASHGFDTLKHHVKSAATAVRVAVHSHAVPADADASVAAPPPVSKSFVNFVGGQAAKIDHLLKEKLKVKRMHCDVQLDVVVGSQVGVAAAQIGVSVTMLQMSWDDSRYEGGTRAATVTDVSPPSCTQQSQGMLCVCAMEEGGGGYNRMRVVLIMRTRRRGVPLFDHPWSDPSLAIG